MYFVRLHTLSVMSAILLGMLLTSGLRVPNAFKPKLLHGLIHLWDLGYDLKVDVYTPVIINNTGKYDFQLALLLREKMKLRL